MLQWATVTIYDYLMLNNVASTNQLSHARCDRRDYELVGFDHHSHQGRCYRHQPKILLFGDVMESDKYNVPQDHQLISFQCNIQLRHLAEPQEFASEPTATNHDEPY